MGPLGKETRAATLAAVAAAVGSKDPVLVEGLVRGLPEDVLAELTRQEERRQSQTAVAAAPTEIMKIVVNPRLLKSGTQVCQAWEKYRRGNGGTETSTKYGS